MKIIDGTILAEAVKTRIKEELKKLPVKPGLAAVLIGKNPASKVYVNRKSIVCEDLGFYFEKYLFEEDTSEEELIALIEKLNEKKNIHGILVQLPLPKHINEQDILGRIKPEKDVDGFHPLGPFVPCTPKGILYLLKQITSIVGKHAVVVGRSNIVGKPTAMLLLDENATVTICHSKTRDLAHYTKQADLLIVAAGKKKLITADMVKEGAVVIDVGVNKGDGSICGDVDFENVKKKAFAITPVPGGVGPMTIAMLMENVLLAAKRSYDQSI